MGDMIQEMKCSRLFVLIIFLSSILSACGTQTVHPPRVRLQLIASGFTSPVELVSADDGRSRLFVADQTGIIWVVADGKRLEKPLLDIRARKGIQHWRDDGIQVWLIVIPFMYTALTNIPAGVNCRQVCGGRGGKLGSQFFDLAVFDDPLEEW